MYFNHPDDDEVYVTHDDYTWSNIDKTSFWFNNIRGNIHELLADVYDL